jgi:hypothetical protein
MFKYLIALTLLVGCTPDREVVQILKGDQGPQGPAGVSCSISQVEGGALLACADNTEVFIANGSPGEAGSPGVDAVASLADYSGASCQLIDGTLTYVKKSGSNYKLYSGSTCHSSTAFAEVSQGEAYWVSTTAVAVYSSSALRVITFSGGN